MSLTTGKKKRKLDTSPPSFSYEHVVNKMPQPESCYFHWVTVQSVRLRTLFEAVQHVVHDAVLCIQNGISAFKTDPLELIRESMRVTRPEGVCIFTSYSDKFWKPRLDWFRLQSEEGLLGEIDWDATQNGVIVCKDGFRATTYRPEDFRKFADIIGVESNIVEIDGSSICCVIKV